MSISTALYKKESLHALHFAFFPQMMLSVNELKQHFLQNFEVCPFLFGYGIKYEHIISVKKEKLKAAEWWLM